ncbi:MAG: hypothetical protein ACE5KH_03670 [Candidatus Geothermarchaeales archaeon]
MQPDAHSEWRATGHSDALARKVIENAIDANLNRLTSQIVQIVPSVVSVYLTGSYSRAEGTAFVDNEEVRFLSDFDLVIISNKVPKTLDLDLHQGLDLTNFFPMDGHPVLEIFVWTLGQMRAPPRTKFLRDFETARLIYGKDLRRTLPPSQTSRLPMEEGLRLLFNRVLGALIPFSPRSLGKTLTPTTARHLTFEAVKLILGSCEALIILRATPKGTSSENVRLFERRAQDWFPDFRMTPGLLPLLKKALEYKLRPTAEVESEAENLWFSAKDLGLQVFEVYMNEAYGPLDSPSKSQIERFVALYPNPLLMRASLVWKIFRDTNRFNLRALRKRSLSSLLACRLHLLASVNSDGTMVASSLNRARDLLAEGVGLQFSRNHPQDLWEWIRECLVSYSVDPFSPVNLLRSGSARTFRFFGSE